ncbi:MAG: threonine/serine dehydratase [Proteobacteria bacterium]|nr:threonine/serine dehydratase [Pseudomonadota bacterium]MBI3498811.1 threonine/serine dehydratase [Pseudomonadota bacterium]
MTVAPTLVEIESTRAQLGSRVLETPIHSWRGREIAAVLGPDTDIVLKLELLQYTGTFKPRGALSVMLNLPADALARGVTAVSAGNHAIAVAYAAQALGTTAKVVMAKSANPYRVQCCRSYGAEVVLVDDVHQAFDTVKRIETEEGRSFVHPFEGPFTSRGTATVALEFCRQAGAMDAVIVAIGGGGLASGVATAVKLLQPDALVLGVEPEGSDVMHRSFAAGQPAKMDRSQTIADSLSPPFTTPLAYALCRRSIDELVKVSDDDIRRAMALMFRELKLAVEPAGAVATAALLGPLRERLRGKRVGLIVCGTNIDIEGFAQHVRLGQAD